MFFILFSACGGTNTYKSNIELNQLESTLASSNLKTDAPKAFSKAKQYLKLAKQALAKNDTEQTIRYTYLAQIETKIAIAKAEQIELEKLYLQFKNKKNNLLEEINIVQDKLHEIEISIERKYLRKHLEAVVDKTVREAAAKEEISERLKETDEIKILNDARKLIGEEMISRASIWQDILNSLINNGALQKNEIKLVNSPIKLAKEKLKSYDMSAVQQYIEETAVEANRLISQAWEIEDTQNKNLQKSISQIKTAGFELMKDEFGFQIQLTVSSNKTKKHRNNLQKQLAILTKILIPYNDIYLVVLASYDSPNTSNFVIKKINKQAMITQKILVESGLNKTRIIAHGCGRTSPISALQQGFERIAILLVPVPKK